MILSGLLLTIFIMFVRSQNTMMVVWGKPTSLGNPVPHFNKTNKWSECIQSCYDWKLCVVAFQNTTGCILYTYDMSPILKKTNAAEGSKVAVKAINSEKGTCPIGINYQNATGYLYDDTAFFPTKVYYNISLTGSYWKLYYFLKPMCSIDDDWTYVTHEDGTSLCVNVYVSETTTPITYDKFIGNCTGRGEYPASIDYPNDARVFTTAIEEALSFIKGTKFYVRIDGKRTEKCRPFPFKEPCSTAAGYEFKNPMFKGSFQYYNWVTNATVRYDMDGNCLVFVYPPAKGQTMKVDVRSCSSYGTIPALAMLCVRKGFT